MPCECAVDVGWGMLCGVISTCGWINESWLFVINVILPLCCDNGHLVALFLSG